MRCCSVKADKHTMAYQIYSSLGEKRTYERVAELMGLSVKTIQQWGYQDKWKERLEQEYKDKSETLKRKREELECLGFEVALDALKEVQAQVKDKKLSKDLASIYETFLSCPLTLMGPSEKENTEETINTKPVDTPETQSVLKQIDESLSALDGDSDG